MKATLIFSVVYLMIVVSYLALFIWHSVRRFLGRFRKAMK